jgi:hypothetical protein
MKKKVLYIFLIIFAIVFIYYLLYLKFREKLPFYDFILNIESNYDFYAEKIIKIIPIILFLITGIKLIRPNSKKRFLRLQASLPTSKIKSLAMGLVEVKGKLLMIEPLISPVNKEECIGYYYTIEDVTKDKEGKYNYSLIHQETKCNVFEIQDKTGNVKIEPHGLEFIMLETTNINSNNNKRYKGTLLKQGQEMLIVGYADVSNNIPFIRKDINSKVFGITSTVGINLWNKYSFLWQSFLFTSFFIAIIIVLIILN